jgi:transmembrane sensor
MAEADWHAFVAWLEADPRHAEAYDRIAMADGVLRAAVSRPQARALPEPANDRGMPIRRWWGWAGGAAACAAAIAAVMVVRPPASSAYALETRPGETRQIALGEGSRIELAGGSRLLLDRARPRLVTIERGEALFHVRHDAADPFIVRSGKLAVQDVGTVFNVTRDGASFTVAVAEGSVLFQPRGQAIPLAAGATLVANEDHQEVRLGRIDVTLVGGWRSGRLTFSDTPVPELLRTVERLYGTRLVADDRLSVRKVTGMISLSGEARRDVPHIASLVGASWRADGERWVLSPAGDSRP